MIKIAKQAGSLLLTYVPDRSDSVQWLDEKLRQDGEVTLRRTFKLNSYRSLGKPFKPMLDGFEIRYDRNKLATEVEKLKKKHVELLAYDEQLRHHADMRVTLDLDDGVKVNYGKFGDLLADVKAVTGGASDD